MRYIVKAFWSFYRPAREVEVKPATGPESSSQSKALAIQDSKEGGFRKAHQWPATGARTKLAKQQASLLASVFKGGLLILEKHS
jgi:hypothetical protein